MRRARLGPSARSSRLAELVPVLLILACLIGEAAVLRLGIDDLDEGYFVQQATRVLHGQVPYRDFESLYTPGLVYLHAAVFGALGGPSVLAARVLALVGRAALALLMYALARRLVRQPVWAAAPALLLLLGLDDAPERWEPHPGWLSTTFALLAAWCLTRGHSVRWLVLAGVAAGAAYAFKQNTGAFSLGALVLYCLVTRRELPASLPNQHGPRAPVVVAASFAAATAVWLIPLAAAVGDPRKLAGFVGAVPQAGLFSPPEPTILIPVACGVAGVWLVRREHGNVLTWYVVAGTALLLTQYPRMDTLHLAWSAPLLLVVGAAVLDRARPPAAIAALLGLIVLSAPTLSSRKDALLQPYVPFVEGLEVPVRTRQDLHGVIEEIHSRTQPGEPIFVYPSSPLLYVLADRPNPTRFDHLNPGAAYAPEIAQVLSDLQHSRTRLVVRSGFWEAVWGPPALNIPLIGWLDAHFTEVARFGAYRVLVADL